MIANLVLLMVLELVSGFCNTLPQFIGVRSVYGIAMGGKIFYSFSWLKVNHELIRTMQV